MENSLFAKVAMRDVVMRIWGRDQVGCKVFCHDSGRGCEAEVEVGEMLNVGREVMSTFEFGS